MKHWSLYISYTLMALLIIALASCSDTDYLGAPVTGNGQGETPMSFSISMGEGKEATRATNGEEYDNTIDLDDVRILVFQAEEGTDKGKFVCEANMPFRSKESTYRYKFSGGVENVDPSKLYSFVALCNTQDALKVNLDDIDFENYTLDELLNTLQYSEYTSTFTEELITGTALIPMWGVVTLYPEDAEITIPAGTEYFDKDNNGKLLGFSSDGSIEIPVQRALAKVQVKVSETTAEYFSLTDVTLNRANPSGFLTPNSAQRYKSTTLPTTGATTIGDVSVKGYYHESYRYTENNQDYPKYLATNNNSDSKMGVNIPAISSTETSPLSFYPTATNEYVILIPEYQNLKDANSNLAENLETDYAKMSLTFSPLADGVATVETTDDETYDLHFANYTQTPLQYFDIVRNTLYDYTVSLESGKLEARVRVMPWEYETMEYELSQNQAMTVTWASFSPYKYDDYGNYALPVAHEDESEQGFVRINVELEQPEGVKWMAHLTNTRDFKFVKSYQPSNGGDLETYSDYGFGGSGEVTIAIAPVNPYEANTNKRTELYFTIETLTEGYAQIDDPSQYVSSATYNNTLNTIPDRICIVQTVKDNIQYTW